MAQKERTQNDEWDVGECRALIDELWSLREAMLAAEAQLAPWIGKVDQGFLPSARNLAHYLALRHKDRRPLQDKLARIGLSSLGRAESNVLANLDKVLGILHRLVALPWQSHATDEPVGIKRSRKLLEQHTASLLGVPPTERAVRIMVTLPSEAAGDYGLIRQLVDSGMDIARINCAHDGATEWKAMVRHVRRAAKAIGRPVRILMDLGGPKLRTDHLPASTPVLKLRPVRDELGRVQMPVRLGLYPSGRPAQVKGASVSIGVEADWLSRIKQDDQLHLIDARDARRDFRVVDRDADGVLAESSQTSYLVPETRIGHRHKGHRTSITRIVDLPTQPGSLRLSRGSMIQLVRRKVGAGKTALQSQEIGCTLPEIFGQVSVGERIWFDDGRIGGIIRQVAADRLEVEITHAREAGEKLAGDKGINLPDSQLELPALTDKDIEDLATVAQEADMVGLSFAQRASDVEALRGHLQTLGAEHLGIVLKIETRRGFENLPELLYAALAGKAAGIMIARGDLAVECGYERLAEVQEEILWAAEAAHLPVIWATQVLETLAQTGLPSRAEITDAAMGERAECVMLNKGPHILDAMHTLDDILRRMQSHQSKKRSLLRALNAWGIGA
ncbi:MAG: pyruvate kinase [Rhodocyclaceae bacterium]|nr:pyruvate kinase [Rhodocyclaceae bacterium]